MRIPDLDRLESFGVRTQDVLIIVVAEFPVQSGRKLLCRCGFGAINIQSLLVFGGAEVRSRSIGCLGVLRRLTNLNFFFLRAFKMIFFF